MTYQAVQLNSISYKVIEFLGEVNRGIRVDAHIDAKVNQIPFHILVDGDSAVISFDSFSDALSLYKMFAEFIRKVNKKHQSYMGELHNLNITVYLQNRHVGVIGPNANPLASRFYKILIYLLGRR